MKNLITNLITILIIVGLVIFIQHKYFPTIINNSTHTSDTIWKDTVITKYVPKPYPIYIDTSRIDTVYIPANDSILKILYLNLHQKYFSTYTYNDTIKNDSLAFMSLETKITQNKPIFYKETYFDRTPSIINNTTNIYSQNEFYIGLNNTAPSLLFKHKNGWIIGGGYDLLNKNERIKIQAYYNLNKLIKK